MGPDSVAKSSTQHIHIAAPVAGVWDLLGDPNRHPQWWPEMLEVECADIRQGCLYRAVTKSLIGSEERELVLERLAGCREVSISCQETGVTTRFLLTEAQGGTFVEGRFSVDPVGAGMSMLSMVAGRRWLRGWLERSLANLKREAERARAAAR